MNPEVEPVIKQALGLLPADKMADLSILLTEQYGVTHARDIKYVSIDDLKKIISLVQAKCLMDAATGKMYITL